MEHPYFGSLPAAADGLLWERDVELSGHPVRVEMLGDHLPSSAQLDAAARFASGLPGFDAAARAALAHEPGARETLGSYMDHHLQELPATAIEALFATSLVSTITLEQFLARLVLRRVGLEPANEERMAVFDYTLAGDVTDYLLALGFDASTRVG